MSTDLTTVYDILPLDLDGLLYSLQTFAEVLERVGSGIENGCVVEENLFRGLADQLRGLLWERGLHTAVMQNAQVVLPKAASS